MRTEQRLLRASKRLAVLFGVCVYLLLAEVPFGRNEIGGGPTSTSFRRSIRVQLELRRVVEWAKEEHVRGRTNAEIRDRWKSREFGDRAPPVVDPWGRPVVIAVSTPVDGGFFVLAQSFGPDGVQGTRDDETREARIAAR